MWIRRHSLAVVAGLAATALAFTGCAPGTTNNPPSGSASGSAPAPSEPVEISLLTHWGGDQLASLEATASAFTEHNPNVTVAIESVPFGNLLTTLRTRGSTPDGPTMAAIYDMWLPELVRDGFTEAAPEDVVSMVKENYSEGAVAAVTKNGTAYGIPTEMAVYGLNYNKDLFKAAGIDKPPATWDELRSAAQAISALGDDVQGLGVVTVWNNGTLHPFLSLAAANGAVMIDPSNPVVATLDTPPMVETATLYEEAVSQGWTKASMSASNADTTGDYLQYFAEGKTGMLIMANNFRGNMVAAIGEDRMNEMIGVAPIPVGPSGTESRGISYSWLNVVNSHATEAQRAAAWQFLAFMNGPDSGENGSSATGDILMAIGILPSRLSDLAAHEEKITADPFFSGSRALVESAVPFPTVIGGEAASQALALEVEAIIFGQKNGKQAMTDAQASVQSALDAAQ